MIMQVPSNGGTDNSPATELCKGSYGTYDKPLQAGSTLAVKLFGTANHEGGGCQFGLSYDNGKSFTLLMTTDESCPIKLDWNVPIPASAPSCTNCVFAWGWIPRLSGAKEYYMNCAKVQIQGGPTTGVLNGPKMEFFNMNVEGARVIFMDLSYEQTTVTSGLTKLFGESTYGDSSNKETQMEQPKIRKTRQIKPEAPVTTEMNNYPANNQGNTQNKPYSNGNGGSASGTFSNPTPNTQSTSNSESTVYGNTQGVSAEELLERAKRFQQRVEADQKRRNEEYKVIAAQQLNQQKNGASGI
jgi:hypothetical protein